MIDLDPRQRGISKKLILVGLAGLGLSALLISPEASQPQKGKVDPKVSIPGGHTYASELTEEDILLGLKARRDAIATFREFVPNYLLERGLVLDQDGPTWWAREIKTRYIRDELYSIHISSRIALTEDEKRKDEMLLGQDYSVSLEYDLNHNLTSRHIRAGRIPAFIIPSILINPIPGFTWLNIPPDRLKDVAVQVYDLPQGLSWVETSYNDVRYMGPESSRRDFKKLIATGEINGRKYRFSIDEQSFSSLNVTESGAKPTPIPKITPTVRPRLTNEV